MPSGLVATNVSYAAYLEIDQAGAVKHEHLNGEVHAMAGGTIEHGALAAAFAGELRVLLRAKPCRVFNSDVRLFVPDTGLTTYPDGMVVCGTLIVAAHDAQSVSNPSLVFEVLLDSTEAYDRGAKWAHYRKLASLEEYVLVNQHERRIEVHRKNADGRFELFEFHAGDHVELRSAGGTISVASVYDNPLAPNVATPE
jgi:Uma2 family endonuclease